MRPKDKCSLVMLSQMHSIFSMSREGLLCFCFLKKFMIDKQCLLAVYTDNESPGAIYTVASDLVDICLGSILNTSSSISCNINSIPQSYISS